MLLLIDNFDSFTYNLVHAFEILGVEVKVVKNNQLNVDQCLQLNPQWIVISPGPGTPSQAGISMDLILKAAGKIPVLGVCLGHQAIAEAFGGTVLRAQKAVHGFLSQIMHEGSGIFRNLPSPFLATRYHSLIVDGLTENVQVTARTANGEIMGIRHKDYPIEGIQFHPEALLTEWGMTLLNNFLNRKDYNYVEESSIYFDSNNFPTALIR